MRTQNVSHRVTQTDSRARLLFLALHRFGPHKTGDDRIALVEEDIQRRQTRQYSLRQRAPDNRVVAIRRFYDDSDVPDCTPLNRKTLKGIHFYIIVTYVETTAAGIIM